MKIIHATHHHLESVSKLFDAYRAFYGQPNDLPAAKQFIADRMSHKESAILLALDTEDGALGFTQLFPAFTSLGLARTYILNDLYVVPDARRKGIAALLLAEAAHYANGVSKWGQALRLHFSASFQV
jgi:GNAT superfamily N-acetyltransferase